MRNLTSQTGYKSVQNLTIIGGTWKAYESSGSSVSAFRFTHGKNITLQDIDVSTTSYAGHTVEIVSCDNVTVKNCTIKAVGKVGSSVEEQVQIDMCTASTAPYIGSEHGSDKALCQKLWNCAPSKNITISGCDITGACAICLTCHEEFANHGTPVYENITIKNNKLTAKSWDALTAWNAKNLKITGNTCISKASTAVPKLNHNHNNGIFVSIFRSPSTKNLGSLVIKNNTAKGKGAGILVWKQGMWNNARQKAKYKKITITGNKCYASKKAYALQLDTSYGALYAKKSVTKNKTYTI